MGVSGAPSTDCARTPPSFTRARLIASDESDEFEVRIKFCAPLAFLEGACCDITLKLAAKAGKVPFLVSSSSSFSSMPSLPLLSLFSSFDSELSESEESSPGSSCAGNAFGEDFSSTVRVFARSNFDEAAL